MINPSDGVKKRINKKIDLIKACLNCYDIELTFQVLPAKVKGLAIIQGDIKIIVINSVFRWNYKRIEEIARHEFSHLLNPSTMYNIGDNINIKLKREKARENALKKFYEQLNNANLKSVVNG